MEFKLVVAGVSADKGSFEVPLALDGSESLDYAVSRFKDALAVVRHTFMIEEGREYVVSDRIDGKPTPEQYAAYLEASKAWREPRQRQRP